ncbi:MAG: preprotein translocase subunit SecA [Microgenomates group bacterium]
MFNPFKSFFDFNKKEIDRLAKRAEEINKLEDSVRSLKDSDFALETKKLQEQVKSGKKTLDEILPYSFALVREAARRVLGTRHYDVQLMAGIALHEGTVAEQKTGEGKTLSATSPLYLNALTGKGVHLVTVNDYLARRDAGWMGQLFSFLGLSVSAIISEQSYIYDPTFTDSQATDWRLIHLRPVSRKEAYDADITYGINSEFGFDYLRDNMANEMTGLVQRGFHYAIIDEVDSVLIDEARTPHIISAAYDKDVSKYYDYATIVSKLKPSDFTIDEKQRTAHLTEEGIATIEGILKVENVYEKDFDTVFHVEAALKARTLFTKDKDYIVKDGEVIIVDEFTGRLLYGRRFSEGLHQAIEAKERVDIKQESRTLATVSLQNYFRMYEKLGGMTGTAATEAEEFSKIYKLNVIIFPTHQKASRIDHSDLIYKTELGKFSAVVADVAAQHKTGRPVLIGTTSIQKNELLSQLLKKNGVPHTLLNAKNHLKEAQIISAAGERGAVTVATNMAGRGVDIVLGGEAPSKYERPVDNDGVILSESEGSQKSKKETKETEKFEKKMNEWRKKHDEVLSLGGLYVIGTERHESRRIDNQLRGRSGRQGDAGETRFFVSLEDDLMRIFGGEQVAKLMNFFNIPEDQPLEHKMVSRALEQSQVKVEGFNFDMRKHLVEYDDVLNKQREVIYNLRNQILRSESKEIDAIATNLFDEEIQTLVNMYVYLEEGVIEYEKLAVEFAQIIGTDAKKLQSELEKLDKPEIAALLTKKLQTSYKKKEKDLGADVWKQAVQIVYLSTIDRYWTEHLTAIDDLRDGIRFRGYAQLDPLVEYKNEAYTMFEKLLSDINYDVSRRLLHIEVNQNIPQAQSIDESKIQLSSASAVDPFAAQPDPHAGHDHSHDGHDHSGHDHSGHTHTHVEQSVPAQSAKVGRNDPCPCGSGLKYKKCGLINAPEHKNG